MYLVEKIQSNFNTLAQMAHRCQVKISYAKIYVKISRVKIS